MKARQKADIIIPKKPEEETLANRLHLSQDDLDQDNQSNQTLRGSFDIDVTSEQEDEVFSAANKAKNKLLYNYSGLSNLSRSRSESLAMSDHLQQPNEGLRTDK